MEMDKMLSASVPGAPGLLVLGLCTRPPLSACASPSPWSHLENPGSARLPYRPCYICRRSRRHLEALFIYCTTSIKDKAELHYLKDITALWEYMHSDPYQKPVFCSLVSCLFPWDLRSHICCRHLFPGWILPCQ